MPLPSLNLARFANRADAALGGAINRQIGMAARRRVLSGAGPMTRMATRRFGTGAGFAVKSMGTAARVGAGLGLAGLGAGVALGTAAATTALGLSYAAGSVYNAAMRAPRYSPGTGIRPITVDRSRAAITWMQQDRIPFTNRHLYSPMISPKLANMIGAGAIGAGIVGGIADNVRTRTGNWATNQMSTSQMPEIERDDFMGATGSLTLAMHRRRFGRPRPYIQQDPVMHAATSLDKNEVIHAIHLAHLAGMGV